MEVVKDKGELNRFAKKNDAFELERFPQCSDFDVPNGLGWNIRNDILFYNDLTKRVVNAFDFDLESGSLGNRKTFFDFNDHSELDGSFPDGLVVDVNNNVWIACWKGGGVIKIDGQTGKLLDKIYLPVDNTTSLCFGGDDYKSLFVVTTSIELDKSPVLGQSSAGKIFGITSPKDNSFRGFQQYCLEV